MAQRVEAGTTELTGNHYLSFPEIARSDGGIASISALHAGLGGIVSWEGDPLVRLTFGRAGQTPAPLHDIRWERYERWIPHAQADIDPGLRIEMTICAPGGYDPLARGGFIACEIHNRGTTAIDIEMVADVRVRGTTLHVARPRPLHGPLRATAGAMQRGIAFETGAPASVIALGIATDEPDAEYAILSSFDERAAPDASLDVVSEHGTVLHAQVVLRLRIRAGRSIRRAIYFGVGRDRDSAVGHAAHLARVGAAPLLREARLELAHITRRAADVQLSDLINRNLLYNHFFGLARAFDDDRLYPLSSRSPLHTPGAAVNEREVLFWTLPCITLTDPLLAREVLRDAFELYSAQPGMQWRYLDGGVIEPGFCLEQALLYPLALDRYVRETADESILDDPLIQDVLREIDGALDAHLHADYLLCDTELLPGGERADHPYPTLGNVLLWAYAQALPRIWRSEDADGPASFDGAADDIAAAIWQRCMADVNGAQVFVSTTDLHRKSAVYDDPLFSLALIPFFGFCKHDDVTLRETLSILRSPAYPFWRAGTAPGLASRLHPQTPALAALCADLLGARKDAALRTVRSLQLTDGLASDLYDADTGASAGGPHAAALAGLLAWSLVYATEGPVRPERKPEA